MMTAPGHSVWRPLAVMLGLVLAVSPLWVSATGMLPARALAVAALAFLLWGGRGGERPLAASPAVLLLAMALVFYSLLPAVVIPWQIGPVLPLGDEMDPAALRRWFDGPGYDPRDYLRRVPGSAGEGLVLAFVGAGAALLAALPAGPQGKLHAPGPRAALAMVVGAGLLFQAGKAALPFLPGAALSAVDACVPVMLAGMASLVLGRAGRLATGLGLAAGTALMFPYALKVAVLFFGVTMVWLILRLRGRARLVPVAVLLVAPVAAAIVLNIIKGSFVYTPWTSTVAYKVVYRQAESVYCMEYALRKPNDGDSPFYALAAVVPRALWPGKPNLSTGIEYGERYCGLGESTRLFGHSASLTLIGEPLARAGAGGLAICAVLMAAILAGAHLAWRKGGQVAVGVFALAPLLIDFDQLFSMYLAINLRAALAAGAVLAAAAFLERKAARRI